ncbi:MAG: hypothetical protein ABIF01_05610 [Candidatus Micrarchaeota archaeon]
MARKKSKSRRSKKETNKTNIETKEVAEAPVEPAIVTYQELNRIPNIHLLRKPSWATGETKREEMELAPSSSYLKKSLLSIPLLFFLSLPLLVVLFLTFLKLGVISVSSLPPVLENSASYLGLAGLWAIGIVVFIPWSVAICSVENWLSS